MGKLQRSKTQKMTHATHREHGNSKIAWNAIGQIFKIMAMKDAQVIMNVLMKEEKVQTKDLIEKTKLSQTKFYRLIRQMKACSLIDRTVTQDLETYYGIHPIGWYVLQSSKQFQRKIREMDPKQLILAK